MPGPTDEAPVDYALSEIVPGFQLIPIWVGLRVPKGTADAIIKRLQRAITTIEGLGTTGLHPLQAAWVEHAVPQCGYCRSGQIMQAAALLQAKPHPSDSEIDSAMAGNLCRCGTYPRIRAAIKQMASGKKAGPAAAKQDRS